MIGLVPVQRAHNVQYLLTQSRTTAKNRCGVKSWIESRLLATQIYNVVIPNWRMAVVM